MEIPSVRSARLPSRVSELRPRADASSSLFPRALFLGSEAPFIGRRRELDFIASSFAECLAESSGRAVVLSGASGIGKSRLAFEAARAVVEARPDVVFVSATASPELTLAPLGVLRSMIRYAFDLRDDDPLETQRERLLAKLARLGASDAERIATYLGEVSGAPFLAPSSSSLDLVRREPGLFEREVQRAVEDWLALAANEGPLVLLVEDLEHADAPSLRVIETALASQRGTAILVLSTTGAEGPAPAFASLERDLLRVGGLPSSAAHSLCHALFGDSAEEDASPSLVEQAGGNAFVLSELVRARRESRGIDAIAPARSIVRARLEALAPEWLHVLGVASVIGVGIHRSSLEAIATTTMPGCDVNAAIEALVTRELLTRAPRSRRRSEDELLFPHRTLAASARSLIDAETRAALHRHVAVRLAAATSSEPARVAYHYLASDEPRHAAKPLRRVAETALAAGHPHDALAAIAQATRVGVEPGTQGKLLCIEAIARRTLGQYRGAEEAARAAMVVAPRGSRAFCRAAGEAALVATRLVKRPQLNALARELLETDAAPNAEAHLRAALSHVAMGVRHACSVDLAVALTARCHSDDRAAAAYDGETEAFLRAVRSRNALLCDDLDAHLSEANAALRRHVEGGPLRRLCRAAVELGRAYTRVGAFVPAERVLRTAIVQAERLGNAALSAHARCHLGAVLVRLGDVDDARAMLGAALSRAIDLGDVALAGRCRLYLASAHLVSAEVAAAEHEAALAVQCLSESEPGLAAYAHALLASAALAQGDAPRAAKLAHEAHERVVTLGAIDEGDFAVVLVHAEALMATGKHSAARGAIAHAHARMLERARKIGDPVMRHAFSFGIAEHVRIAERFAEWL